jgi:hypothetical protein
MSLDAFTLENWISQAGTAGWDWFKGAPGRTQEQLDAAKAKAQADIEMIAGAWRDFANTEPGRRALQALIDGTLNKTVSPMGMGLTMEQAALFGAAREGQNNIVWLITKLIAHGRDPQDQPKSREPQ